MNPFLIFLLGAGVVIACYFVEKKVKGGGKIKTETDNLRKYFGDDYGKIVGGNIPQDNATEEYSRVISQSPSENKRPASSAIDDILNRPSPKVNNVNLYGESPINAVINQKMGGASFLGIRINVVNGADMPKKANDRFCSLVSLMLAKGIGACAKSEVKTITFSVTSEEGSSVITCTYPERAIPETDEKIRSAATAMGGAFTSETIEAMTTDRAVIAEEKAL